VYSIVLRHKSPNRKSHKDLDVILSFSPFITGNFHKVQKQKFLRVFSFAILSAALVADCYLLCSLAFFEQSYKNAW
jgi:hypothetical protein